MNFQFSKYQGTGNDFILFDNRDQSFPDSTNVIQQLCDRKFGIGSDGLILIEDHPSLDYRMVFFNPDGSKSLCGNGSRCGFAFAQKIGLVNLQAQFETTDGVHEAVVTDGGVRFSLFDVNQITSMGKDYYVDTGSPHYIKIVEDIESIDVIGIGKEIRYSEAYIGQNGTNVNFAQLLHDRIKVRTYERGVENETLSCGTGVTAVGLVASKLGYKSPVIVEARGGQLTVEFEEHQNGFKKIWLSGPATHVFDGSVEI